MSIQNQLRNATYRGLDCLVKNSRIKFGPKTVVHEYPNSNRVEVEYLGEMAENFSLEIIIKGFGDEYFARRNTFKEALLKASDGILQHPYEGQLNCAVVGIPYLIEGDTESGIATFIVDFIKVDNKIFPTETLDNRGILGTIRDSLESANLQWIANVFKTNYSATYDAAKTTLEDVGDIYSIVTDSASIADSKISGVKNTIRTYNNNTLSYLSGSDNLSNGLVDLYNSLTDIGQTPEDQLRLWFDLFDSVPANPVYTTSTSRRIEELNNTDVIYSTAKTQTLANAYNYTPELSFASVDEIDEYRAQLESRYREIVDLDTSIPSTSLSKTGLDDSDVAYDLGLLRDETQKYLDGLENTVGEVITVENVQSTTLTEFVYSQYGNLDRYDEVLDLNSIEDPTSVSGDIQIIV